MLEAVAKIVSDENREWEGSPTELAEALRLDMAVNRLTKHLNVNASRLLDEHQVKYENKTKHAGRRIRLTYMVIEAPMVESNQVKRDACNGRDGVLRGTLSTVATVATVAEKKM